MIKTKYLSMIAVLLVAFAKATSADEFNSSQAHEIKKIVRTYLVENPDVVDEALIELKKRREDQKRKEIQKAIKANHQLLFNSAGDHILGNPQGQTAIVVFLDPICGHCRHFYGVLQEAVKDDKNLKVILKDVPFLGPAAVQFSKFLLAAGNQGKYLAAYDLIHKTPPINDEKEVLKLADSLKGTGLDLTRFQKDFRSEDMLKRLQANLDLAQKIGVDATPSFVINGDLFAGYVDLETLRKLLKGQVV